MDIKKALLEQLNCSLIAKDQLAELVCEIDDVAMGDFTIPCFKLSKQLRKSPNVIAQEIASNIVQQGLIEKVEAVNGYVNIFLKRTQLAKEIATSLQKQCCDNKQPDTYYNGKQQGNNNICDASIKQKQCYGKNNAYQGKTVCIDFSSVNIAKPFHMGHLGTTAIGNALSNMYSFCGAKVVRINHLGDWGTQFGKLIVAFKLWGNKEEIDKSGLKGLNDIYVRFHAEEENNPQLTQQARDWFAKIEKNDAEATRLFEYFKEITLREVKLIYKRLNVDFDSWDGESFFNDKMQPALDDLRAKGLVEKSDGAEVVMLGDKMPPCLLVKSDGASLYATRDIAAAIYRKKTYDFDKCLYVVAYQQNLHFQQYFKVLEMAGFGWAKDLVHVAYGVVSLEEGAMSTRKGNTVWLSDVLDRAVEKARSIIEEKSPQLEDKEKTAEQIGIGAVVFSALANAKIKDVVFTYDRVLNFDGETCPYLQYTCARTYSVLEKAAFNQSIKPDFGICQSASCHTVVKLLAKFENTILNALENYEPSVLSNYLIDLAKAFNKMYLEHRIIRENAAEQNALLILAQGTNVVLVKGLELLGISCPKKM